MFRFLFVLLVAKGFTYPIYSQAPDKPKGRKVAFLVTVSDYGASGLTSIDNAEMESDLLELSLEVSGYLRKDIHTLTKLDTVQKGLEGARPNASAILEQLQKICKSLDEHDTLLFAFNGHCARVDRFKEKGLMLLPQEVRLSGDESMIPLTQVYKVLEECKAKQKLVLLSPCRSDIVKDEATRERIGSLLCPTLPDPPKSVVLISSCGHLEQSAVTKTGSNPFFVKFAEVLSTRIIEKPTLTGSQIVQALKPIISANDVADFVKGDLKGLESWVLSDAFVRPSAVVEGPPIQSSKEWAEYASTSRKVIFEKNEPVAVILEIEKEAKQTTFSIIDPFTKKNNFRPIQLDPYPVIVGFSNDGTQTFVSANTSPTVVMSSKTTEIIQKVEHPTPKVVLPNQITRACFSPMDDYFLTCDRHGNAAVWDLKEKKQVRVVSHDSPVIDACFLQGGFSFVTITEKGEVQVWPTKKGEMLWGTKLPTSAYSLAPTPDGLAIAIGRSDGKLMMCSSITGKTISVEKVLDGPITQIRFSPSGRQVAVSGWDKILTLWDTTSDEFSTLRHDSQITFSSFSPDGKTLATGDRNGVLKIWDFKNGKRINSFECKGWITHLAYSPDSKKLVVILHHGEAQVWDTVTAKRLDKIEEKKKE